MEDIGPWQMGCAALEAETPRLALPLTFFSSGRTCHVVARTERTMTRDSVHVFSVLRARPSPKDTVLATAVLSSGGHQLLSGAPLPLMTVAFSWSQWSGPLCTWAAKLKTASVKEL